MKTKNKKKKKKKTERMLSTFARDTVLFVDICRVLSPSSTATQQAIVCYGSSCRDWSKRVSFVS
jgi:hypothetical protein